MPIRFRRTFKIFPGVKINVSKSGISTTIGPRGLHLTFNRHGVRQSIGLPGSGLSESSYILKNKDRKAGDAERDKPEHVRDDEEDQAGYSSLGCLVLLVLLAALGYWGASVLGWIPANTLSDALRHFSSWVQTKGF